MLVVIVKIVVVEFFHDVVVSPVVDVDVRTLTLLFINIAVVTVEPRSGFQGISGDFRGPIIFFCFKADFCYCQQRK